MGDRVRSEEMKEWRVGGSKGFNEAVNDGVRTEVDCGERGLCLYGEAERRYERMYCKIFYFD